MGNNPSLNPIKYWSSDAKTKDGTEIQITTITEITWSIQVFFLTAARIPKPIPRGIEIIREKMFS